MKIGGEEISLPLTLTVDLRIFPDGLRAATGQGEKLIEEETDTFEEAGKKPEPNSFPPLLSETVREEDTLHFKCHSGLTKAASPKVFPKRVG